MLLNNLVCRTCSYQIRRLADLITVLKAKNVVLVIIKRIYHVFLFVRRILSNACFDYFYFIERLKDTILQNIRFFKFFLSMRSAFDVHVLWYIKSKQINCEQINKVKDLISSYIDKWHGISWKVLLYEIRSIFYKICNNAIF